MTVKKKKSYKPLIDAINKGFEQQNIALSKPKTIIRDINGKIIGVKTND